MSNEPQLYRINTSNRESDRIEEVNFDQLGLKEVTDMQEWVATNPGILGEDLLIIAKEFNRFDRTNERPDLLAVDRKGTLVIIELKRDDSGKDVHWQAIKYASYLHRATPEQIVRIMADYKSISQEDAGDQLLEHLDVDNPNALSALNTDQRIILASHRFAPEVTSASLWLNEKTSRENLITCVTLIPYRDANTGSLYVQSTTIIPVPGIDDYVVGIGSSGRLIQTRGGNSFAENLRKAYDRNKNDEVTRFTRKVKQLTLEELPTEVRPDETGRWAGGWPQFRYYNFWYSRGAWSNHKLCYFIHLRPEEEDNTWQVVVGFNNEKNVPMKSLDGARLHEQQKIDQNRIYVGMGPDTLNDDFASSVAEILREFIEQITPIVDEHDKETTA